jgi:hypothetical protein
MLDPARYLLGCAELVLLVGSAWLGATRARSRLVPTFRGAPAHLATGVLATALVLWTAEVLGTISLLKPAPYLIAVTVIGLALYFGLSERPDARPAGPVAAGDPPPPAVAKASSGVGPPTAPPAGEAAGLSFVPSFIAFLIAAVAVIHFAAGVKTRLSTGMTGFDSTWYHAPFAAGFYQSGNTIDLHLIAPQFLAWFYPANSEVVHAVGMLAFGRDLLSPLLNLGWFLGCLLACWCIGRPFGVAPWSLALGAIVLSVPALSDQAGEARNDIVGIFFLLAAIAIAVNVRGGLSRGSLVLVGLAAGLAAGTKLNFLLPAAVLVLGLALITPRGNRWRALATAGLGALAGGGYWYLRNLAHSGNPLPWIHHLGPITLPAPEQALGGREAHSVLSYLTAGTVWSDWFLPGLHGGLWIAWPLIIGAALGGLLIPLVALLFGYTEQKRHATRVLAVVGLVGLASALAWLIAPTSASGPEGMPHGFESGLRYLAPALVLGLALLPTANPVRRWLVGTGDPPNGRILKMPGSLARHLSERGIPRAPRAAAVLLVVVALGYPVQRHYLRSRYANPTFTNPGLDAAFRWANGVSNRRIATTSTRQYPLFGADLSNHVQFVGLQRPHGGFESPATCRQWRQLLNAGHYDYAVTTRDRPEPGKPAYPETTRWTEAPQVQVILRKAPTVVFKLRGRLDPSACP